MAFLPGCTGVVSIASIGSFSFPFPASIAFSILKIYMHTYIFIHLRGLFCVAPPFDTSPWQLVMFTYITMI